jgi:hypothetical protein
MSERIRILRVSPELVCRTLETGNRINVRVLSGLPTGGAKLLRVVNEKNSFAFVFSHEAWAEIPEGHEPPSFDVCFESMPYTEPTP